MKQNKKKDSYRPSDQGPIQGKGMPRITRRLATILIIGGVACSLLIFHLINNSMKLADIEEEKVVLDQEQAEVEGRQKDLKEYINLLEDDEYILQIARSEYLLSKDGEIIFNLLEKEEPEDDQEKDGQDNKSDAEQESESEKEDQE